jgi:hypothetical protein
LYFLLSIRSYGMIPIPCKRHLSVVDGDNLDATYSCAELGRT